MKYFSTKIKIIVLVISLTNTFLLAQPDSSFNDKSIRFEYLPAFHSIQIDGNLYLTSYEVGGHFDFDFFRAHDNVCLGTRLSVEHYTKGDFGGSYPGSPFTNYNLYIRFSKISEDFSFNFLCGLSYYRPSEIEEAPDRGLPRVGFEIKYGRIVGIILKGSTSFRENTGFIGIGLSIDYCHIL